MYIYIFRPMSSIGPDTVFVSNCYKLGGTMEMLPSYWSVSFKLFCGMILCVCFLNLIRSNNYINRVVV